jgi:hypothetical protein
MKYLVLKWRINGKGIWETVDIPEEKGKAYWPLYLKPLETSIIQKVKDFTNIKNKALKPNKRGRKNG